MGGARQVSIPAARIRAPAASGLIRARLQSALDGLNDNRLGLVVAPAGAGKTTVLARWVRGYSGVVAWYRAETEDAAGAGVAPRMAAAIRQALADRGVANQEQLADRRGLSADRSEADLGAGLSSTPDPDGDLDAADVALLAERAAERILLVVDDLHELAGTSALADLERLLLLAPPNLRIVLSTRTMPAVNLARIELSQPLVIVGDDLRFRSWEVEGLFRDFYGEPLRPDDAAALARRTDGWAAALTLFHLATAGRSPVERSQAVRSLAGRARYARDYLSGQVLAGLPDELRDLLRRTCVFDVVTASRCAALLGGGGHQNRLEELVQRQALTTTDDHGETFRYHEVLRRHLETSLHEELGGEGMRAWYCRAAEILEADGAIVEALRARCRGGDWPGVQRLLRRDGKRLVDDRATDWAELLPGWLTQSDPWVGLAEARRLLDDGQFEAAERAARHASDQFTDVIGKELCRDVARTARVWVSGPSRVDARWADVLRSAMQRDPLDHVDRARALGAPFADLVEGAALMMGAHLEKAMAAFSLAAGRDDQRVALSAQLWSCALAGWMDHYTCDQRQLDAICLATERLGLTWLNRVSRGIALSFNGGAREVREARQIAVDCTERGDPWGALLIVLYLATTLLSRGRPDLDLIDEGIADCHTLGLGTLEACGRCWRALAVAVKRYPEAEQEAREAEAFARAAGISSALPIVYTALAEVGGDDLGELRELAESTGSAVGLDCRSWLWGSEQADTQPSSEPGDHVSRPGPELMLRCFGSLRLTIGGVAPDLSGIRPRARALLRLLAMHAGQPVHRERLLDALWPDLDVDSGTHNLQVAISSLRRMLQPLHSDSLIARHGDAYLLTLGDTGQADVREFEAEIAAATQSKASGDGAAAAASFTRALEYYTADLLTEDGAAEWVLETRERYRVLAAEAAASLAALELERGDAAAAAAAASRGVQIDRYHDASWRELIRAHQRRGDRAAAQRAQQSYDAVLESLGVSVAASR